MWESITHIWELLCITINWNINIVQWNRDEAMHDIHYDMGSWTNSSGNKIWQERPHLNTVPC